MVQGRVGETKFVLGRADKVQVGEDKVTGAAGDGDHEFHEFNEFFVFITFQCFTNVEKGQGDEGGVDDGGGAGGGEEAPVGPVEVIAPAGTAVSR